MKVKVELKVQKNQGKLFKEILKKALDKPTLDEIGRQVVALNQKAVRSGNLPDGGELPELSKGWIKRRSLLKKFNNTGPAFSPKRSNLTFTGQLLNAIFFRSNPSDGSIDIEVLNTKRTSYSNMDGKPSKSKQPTNKKLAEYIAQKGIIFVGLTENARERANKILMAKLRQLLRSLK